MTARERPVEFAALDGRKSAKAAGHAYPIPVIKDTLNNSAIDG